MTRLTTTTVLLAVAVCLSAAGAYAQEPEPQTRAETLLRQREEKSRNLEPPEKSGLERFLMDLESGRLFERLINPAEGVYPKLGNITTGSGFSFGPAYRKPEILGGHADFSTFAAVSMSRYWMLDARLRFPRLASERVLVDVHAQRYDFPEEDFFGLGPASNRDDEVTYALANTIVGGAGTYRPTRWLNLTAGLDWLRPDIRATTEPGSLLSRFAPSGAPGVLDQPDYLRYTTMVDVNMREPQGNPRRGGQYKVTHQRYDDNNGQLFSFDRVEVDLQQYVPIVKDRRVLALRGRVTMTDALEGAQVPFYLQPTLGGPDDLRGFRHFRFRDRNSLLLQAEYRWEIFTAVDGAIFVDAGKVAPRREDLDFRNLESDYGIGFRFGTVKGVFLRVEGAFGSSAGAHFVLRYGHVF